MLKACYSIIMIFITSITLSASDSLEVNPFESYWTYPPEYWQPDDGEIAGASVYDGEWCLYEKPGVTYSKLELEAKVTPGQGRLDGWSSTAIGIYLDRENYWLLMLTQSPESAGSVRMAGLSQMSRGQWLSEAKLPLVKNFSGGDRFNWAPGQEYSLKISLSPQTITGTIGYKSGNVVWQKSYALNSDCVRTGVPALYVNFQKSKFGAISMASAPGAQSKIQKTKKYPEYSSMATAPLADIPGSGFFAVEKSGGKYNLVTPDGKRYFALGTDHINYYKHFCEKLGYSPYNRSVEKKYGSPAKWAEATVKRLQEWNFTALGAGSSPEVRHAGLPHTESLAFGYFFSSHSPMVEKGYWNGFPNVFDPGWPDFCMAHARKLCQEQKDDPWLLGYYLDNELEWFGRTAGGSEYGLFIEIMRQPKSHSAKQALVKFLSLRHKGKIGSFNKAWHQKFKSWGELLDQTELPAISARALSDQEALCSEIGDRYFKATSEAVRKADGNHLILGSRFAGNAPRWAWRSAGKYCDIVSFNFYPHIDLDSEDTAQFRQRLNYFHQMTGKPLMVTEWSILGLDSGQPCKHGGGMRVDSQQQRSRACELLQQTFAELSFMVGSNYFMWADEPKLGISSTFPEDGNYGLVNNDDEPYTELTEMFARVNGQALNNHITAQIHLPEAVAYNPLNNLPAGGKNHRVKYERKGKNFRIDNGVLRIECDGSSGNFADRILLDGKLLGRYNPMVRQYYKKDMWLLTDLLEKVSFQRKGKKLIVDLIGSGGGNSPQGVAKIGESMSASSVRFRVCHRWIITPGQPWFLTRVMWVANADKKNVLRAKSLFVSLYPQMSGNAADDYSSGRGLPYYYKDWRRAFWIDKSLGLRFGIMSTLRDSYNYIDGQGALKINYYLDAQGQQHPDARIELSPLAELLPGAVFEVKGNRDFLILGAEKDNFPGLEKELKVWSQSY